MRPDVTSSRMVEMIHTAIDRAPDKTAPLLSVGYNRWGLYTFMLLATGAVLFLRWMRVPPVVGEAATTSWP